MFKKLKIAMLVTGLLFYALVVIFGSEINAKLIDYQGSLDWLFGSILVGGSVSVFALALWAQLHDKNVEGKP